MRSGRLLALLVALGATLLAVPAQAATPVQKTWAGEQIRLYNAFSAGWTGRGVTVAVLDGWIDTSHPDFAGRVAGAADCTSGTCTTTVRKDTCGQHHGTHVAGTVASSSYGAAPGARLLAVRVLADDGSGDCAGDPADVAAGIRWAVARGARVLNLSLGPDVPGTGSTGPLPTAVREAADAGVVVVFSAGNADLPVAQAYGQDALVVAATNNTGALANYSQHGQGVSVAAPGGQPNSAGTCDQSRCITSLFPSGQYAVAAGTSMAAPHVAGLAALLVQQRPSWSRDQVVDRITSTARPLSGAGAGLVDATAALGVRPAVTPRATATRSPTPSPKPKAQPAVTRSPAPVAASPSPVAVRTSPAAVPAPTASPTAAGAPTPEPNAPSLLGVGRETEVPIPLAGLAGALAGLAGMGVLLAAVSRR